MSTGSPEREADDLIEREQRARLDAEAAERRIAFLYEATTAIYAGPLDGRGKLLKLAQLAVPHLADWCVIDLIADGGVLERVGINHWDPARAEAARPSLGRVTWDPDRATAFAELLRGGGVDGWSPTDSRSLDVVAGDLPAAVLANVRSLVRAPLATPSGRFGVATFVFAQSHRSHSLEDVALIRDLCTRAAWAYDNARLFEQAERTARTRENLMAIVSHDLKNPLSIILMAAGLLKDGGPTPTDPWAVKHLERILRAARRMDRLIHDLLDWSVVESGHLKIEVQPWPIKALLAEAIEVHQLAITERQQVLTAVSEAGDATARCDRGRVLQVFSNLIGNAIKYAPAGSAITLGAVVQGSWIRFAVADRGPGISPEQRAQIFDPYWQARPTGRDGIGLGLSIAAGIVHAHGGEIGVGGEVGKGAEFFFTIPRG